MLDFLSRYHCGGGGGGGDIASCPKSPRYKHKIWEKKTAIAQSDELNSMELFLQRNNTMFLSSVGLLATPIIGIDSLSRRRHTA